MSLENACFSTPYVEICPAQRLRSIKTERLHQADSLNRLRVLEQMLPNSLLAYDNEGQVFSVESDNNNLYLQDQAEKKQLIATLRSIPGVPSEIKTFDFDIETAGRIRGLYTVPIGSWGSVFDIMHLDLGKELPPALNDLPSSILDWSVKLQTKLIKELLELGGPVYTGINNSAGCLNGLGLMSVLYPHSHTWKFSQELNDLTPDKIKTVRNEVTWDGGISSEISQDISKALKNNLLPNYWPSAQVEVDKMGFTIDLPGFNPDDLSQKSFIKNWHDLSLIVHESLRQFHRSFFESELNEVIEYVQGAHLKGKIDQEEYNKLFRVRQGQSGDVFDKLQAFNQEGLLRYPCGWAGGIQFRPEGAFIGIIFGFLNDSMGPVESMGVKLQRPEAALSLQAMQQKSDFYQKIFKKIMV